MTPHLLPYKRPPVRRGAVVPELPEVRDGEQRGVLPDPSLEADLGVIAVLQWLLTKVTHDQTRPLVSEKNAKPCEPTQKFT
jgi:hypothetical protein